MDMLPVRRLLEKFAKEEAPGIPDKKVYGDLSRVEKGQKLRLIIQEHNAEKAGHHYDIRLVDEEKNKAYSFVIKDLSVLTTPNEKALAVRQPLHTADYSHWSGVIPSGYGKGTVKVILDEPIEVVDAQRDKFTVIIPKGKVVTELTFVAPEVNDRKRKRDWLLVNHTTYEGKFDISYHKPPYKEQKFDTIDVKNPNYIMTAKIDGAHAIAILRPGKTPRFFSYRKSSLNRPLEYTWKMPPEMYLFRWPSDKKEIWLRGEVFGVYKDTEKSIPENELGRILNSSVDKAREYMAKNNIELRFAPFMVERIGEKEVQLPYSAQLPILKEVAEILPKTELPAQAVTQAEKERMMQLIKERKFRQTQEGVVLWPLHEAGQPIKAKVRPDFDVIVKDIFMEKGIPLPKKPGTKYIKRVLLPDGTISYEYPKDVRPPMAGGFYYSRAPDKPVVGRVGTGFSIPLKIDMALHPEKYKGLVARVTAMHEFPSGALRAPAFIGWHHEKSGPRASKVIQQ